VKLTIHLHLVPRSRMRGAITPLPQYVLIAWCLVKHSDNFTFLLGYYSWQGHRGADLFLLLATASRQALEPTNPSPQWVPGVLFEGLKGPVRETDHTPPSSAEFKNAWSCTSTLPYIFMFWCLVKQDTSSGSVT
jgi:hypothetical protein